MGDVLPEIRFEVDEVPSGHFFQARVSGTVAVGPEALAVVAHIVDGETVAALVEGQGVFERRVGGRVPALPHHISSGIKQLNGGLPRHLVGFGPHDESVVIQIGVRPRGHTVESGIRFVIARLLIDHAVGLIDFDLEQHPLFIVPFVQGGVVVGQIHFNRLEEGQVACPLIRGCSSTFDAVAKLAGGQWLGTVVADPHGR